MKSLKIYYAHVGIPIALVVLAAVVFWPQLLGTVQSNPHPQINYMIIGLIVFGSVQMWLHVRRINREGQAIQKFFDLYDASSEQGFSAVSEYLLQQKQQRREVDVAPVLEFLLALHNQTPGPMRHAAIESEIERFQVRQNRRLLLAQFMSGMMVGLGLLGTFIGLLGALSEIGKLIGSFDLSSGITNPTAAISELVTRLTEPMKAMGIAFSASLFGVLGSLIMGVLMVSVRGAASDLSSNLHSKVTQILDFSNEVSGVTTELSSSGVDLQRLLPMTHNLLMALDQSERRVRDLLTSVGHLVGKVEISTQSSHQVLDALLKQQQDGSSVLQALNRIQGDTAQTLVLAQARSNENSGSESVDKTATGWSQVAMVSQQAIQTLAMQVEQQLKTQATWVHKTHERIEQEQTSMGVAFQDLGGLIRDAIAAVKSDSQSRAEFAHHLQVHMAESQSSQERWLQTVGTILSSPREQMKVTSPQQNP
jgi:flagellar motor component MotA